MIRGGLMYFADLARGSGVSEVIAVTRANHGHARSNTIDDGALYLLAADAILFVHVLFVGFVILGLILIVLGKFWSSAGVRNPWFRYVHLASIGVVVLQSWLGAICPLTMWEMALREKAGDAIYAGAFVAHWLEAVLYYRAPAWVFVAGYTLFGVFVAATWIWVRPRR